jgi:hypothetical protein
MTLQHFTLEHLTLMCNFLTAPELLMQASVNTVTMVLVLPRRGI